MPGLSSSDLLDVWEQGSGLHMLDRGLLALILLSTERSPLGPSDWSIGRRNRALIELHERLFGPALWCWARCPNCGERMEFEIDSRELVSRNPANETGETVVFRDHTFRLPTSRDLAEAARQKDPNAAVSWLVARCRVKRGKQLEWSPEEIEELSEAMADADPMSEIQLRLDCPKCGHASNEVLEIASFLWSKIDASARRLLWEIHQIALQYGWTQDEILSLTATRRALYLSMVQT